jgi:integrase
VCGALLSRTVPVYLRVFACGKRGFWLRSIFEVGYTLGWRLRELLNLRVRQVDLEAHTISLDPFTTKNKKPRKAVLPARAYGFIQQCVAGKEPNDFVSLARTANGFATSTAHGTLPAKKRSSDIGSAEHAM